jgi:hypothetical protein
MTDGGTGLELAGIPTRHPAEPLPTLKSAARKVLATWAANVERQQSLKLQRTRTASGLLPGSVYEIQTVSGRVRFRSLRATLSLYVVAGM